MAPCESPNFSASDAVARWSDIDAGNFPIHEWRHDHGAYVASTLLLDAELDDSVVRVHGGAEWQVIVVGVALVVA